jgi:hypothetical protein
MAGVEIPVGVDTSAFAAGLASIRSQVAALKGQIAGTANSLAGNILGGLGIGALFSGFKEVLDSYGRVDDLARATGSTTDEIQQLGYAAKLSGSDVEGLLSAFTKAEVKLAQFTKGASELGDEATSPKELELAWQQVGVSIDQALKMTKTEKLLAVSKALSEMTDATQRQYIAFTIFGKSAQSQMPVLTDYEALKKSIKETPLVSAEDIAAIAKLGDAMDSITQKLKVLAGSSVGFWSKMFDDKAPMQVLEGMVGYLFLMQGMVEKGIGKITGIKEFTEGGKKAGIYGAEFYEGAKTKTQLSLFGDVKQTDEEIKAAEEALKIKQDADKAAVETANFLRSVDAEAEARNIKFFGVELSNLEKLQSARELMQKAYTEQKIDDYKRYAGIVDQLESDMFKSQKSFNEAVDKMQADQDIEGMTNIEKLATLRERMLDELSGYEYDKAKQTASEINSLVKEQAKGKESVIENLRKMQNDAALEEMSYAEKIWTLKKVLNEQLAAGEFEDSNKTATELGNVLKEQNKARKDIEKDNVISGGLRSVGGGGAFASKVDTSLLDTNIKQLNVLQEIREKISGNQTLTLR